MRPQRIVVGEVRQQECLDLLLALNSGIAGNAEAHINLRSRRVLLTHHKEPRPPS
jgi:Flp pilus assembly CpaF family ATPase